MAPISGIPALFAALSERNYRTFSVGNILSHNGTWAQRTAVLWFTWEMTRSGFWLGLITVAELLPVLIIGPVAGAIADRVNLLNMMKIIQVLAFVQSAALAALTFAGVMTPELLFLMVLAHGIILSFNQPARLAMLPHLVRRENLSAAFGINSMIFNSARATGPMISGVLIGGWGIALAFVFNALSYVWFIGSLLLLRLSNPRSAKARTPICEVPREVIEGIRYAIDHVGIARMLIVLSVFSILGRSYMELLAGFAGEVFGLGAQGYALMVSMTGIGAMIGGFWLAQRGQVSGLVSRVVLALLLFSLALIGFAATNLFAFALFCLLITGFAVIVVGVGEQTLLQNAVDPAMRGRVMSLYGMISRGAPAIGAIIMGSLAEIGGFQAPFVIGAILLLVLWWWARKQQGEMRESLELKWE